MADYYCEGRLWEQLYAFVREEQIKLSPGTNNLAIYHNGGTTEDGVDIEVGWDYPSHSEARILDLWHVSKA